MAQSETDRFLKSLYQQARQDGEDPEEVAKRIWQNNRGVSRRELLGGAGALGLGAAMGGGGAMAATGNAAADANTTDNDGNVGTPNDRVDVFAEGSDVTQQSITGSVIRAFSPNNNYFDDYLISNYADIGAAILQANDDGAAFVQLPGGSFDFSTEIVRGTGDPVHLRLEGTVPTTANADYTTLNYTGSGKAFDFDTSQNLILDGVYLSGPGSGSGTTGIEYGNTLWIIASRIENFGTGVQFSDRGSTNYTRIERSTFRSNDQGANIAGNNVVVNGCRFGPQDSENIVVQDANHLSIHDTAVEGAGSNGIYANTGFYGFGNPRAWSVRNCYFESNDSGDMVFAGSNGSEMRGLEVSWNYISSDANASQAIQVDDLIGAYIGYNVDIGSATDSLQITADAREVRTEAENLLTNGVADSGTRTLREGVGENAGDPSSTGQWNGNGREGIEVVDTSNNTKYAYRGGAWV